MSWEQTLDTETLVEWEGQNELETLLVHVVKMVKEPPDESWWVVVSFLNIEKYLQKGFPTRAEAITEAEEERRILGLFKQLYPISLKSWNRGGFGDNYSEMDGDAFFLTIEEEIMGGAA
jgi:hypothetical protein